MASNASTGGSALPVDELTDKPGATASDLQFPSLAGKPNVEVAKRTADTDKTTSTSFEKVFVLLRREWDVADKDAVHAASAVAVRQFLTNNGFRTDKVDVEFVGEEDVPGENPLTTNPYDRSVGLRYRVAAVPAAIVDSGGIVSETNLPDDYDATIVKTTT
jgi:hypothetical protein